MTFLPIVGRELRVASRRRSTYWWRTLAGGVAILFGTWLFLMLQWDGQSQLGIARFLFGLLTGCAACYGLMSGAMNTTDCLSSERREGTLGLLFLTDLKGYDVVLGKLAAGSLRAFYGMMAVLPVLAVPLIIGGISAGEEARMALVALNALFFSLALGMAVSSVNRSARAATLKTYAMLLLITAGAPACGAWVAYLTRNSFVEKLLLLPSTGFSYATALDVLYRPKPRQFWESAATIHALSWGLLIFASLVTPRVWQDKPEGVRRLRWRDRWQLWSHGNAAERNSFRRRLLETNAYFWLAARSRLKPALVWGVLGLIACGWVWGLTKFRRDWLNTNTFVITGFLLNTLLKTWFGSEAGRQLAEDRAQGTLELLLSTPLKVRDLLEGQLLALLRQFLGPLMVVLAADLFFMGSISLRLMGPEVSMADEGTPWICWWGAAIIMLIADLMALFWVGQWQALTSKNPVRATIRTQLLILALPVAAWAMSMMAAVMLSANTPSPGPGWKTALGLWLGFGLAADAVFGLYAREKLLTEFRQVAPRGFGGRF